MANKFGFGEDLLTPLPQPTPLGYVSPWWATALRSLAQSYIESKRQKDQAELAEKQIKNQMKALEIEETKGQIAQAEHLYNIKEVTRKRDEEITARKGLKKLIGNNLAMGLEKGWITQKTFDNFTSQLESADPAEYPNIMKDVEGNLKYGIDWQKAELERANRIDLKNLKGSATDQEFAKAVSVYLQYVRDPFTQMQRLQPPYDTYTDDEWDKYLLQRAINATSVIKTKGESSGGGGMKFVTLPETKNLGNVGFTDVGATKPTTSKTTTQTTIKPQSFKDLTLEELTRVKSLVDGGSINIRGTKITKKGMSIIFE